MSFTIVPVSPRTRLRTVSARHRFSEREELLFVYVRHMNSYVYAAYVCLHVLGRAGGRVEFDQCIRRGSSWSRLASRHQELRSIRIDRLSHLC